MRRSGRSSPCCGVHWGGVDPVDPPWARAWGPGRGATAKPARSRWALSVPRHAGCWSFLVFLLGEIIWLPRYKSDFSGYGPLRVDMDKFFFFFKKKKKKKNMTDVSRLRSPPGDDRQGTHQPAGPSGLRQPEPAHGRRPRPRHAGELPVPGEDQPLRPGAHPRARRTRPRRRPPTATSRRTARGATSRSPATPGPSCSRRPASARRSRPLLHRHRRPRLLRGRP